MAFSKKNVAAEATIQLQRLVDKEVEVTIKGLTPYIPHQWSEKSKKMMPGHPEGDTVKTKKGLRKPEEEAESCVYRLPDGRAGIPATAIKAAMVAACRFFDKPSMVEAKTILFVQGEGDGPYQLVPIQGDEVLREDTARNANGGADLRYRYEIRNWSATVTVRFIPSSISEGSVIALLDAAGRVGVGDWRPSAPKSSTGIFGTFRVEVEYE